MIFKVSYFKRALQHVAAVCPVDKRLKGKPRSMHPGFWQNGNIDGDTAAAVDYDWDGRLYIMVSEGN